MPLSDETTVEEAVKMGASGCAGRGLGMGESFSIPAASFARWSALTETILKQQTVNWRHV